MNFPSAGKGPSSGSVSAEIASAALSTRVAALAKWTGEHDPNRLTTIEATLETAPVVKLADLDGEIAFQRRRSPS